MNPDEKLAYIEASNLPSKVLEKILEKTKAREEREAACNHDWDIISGFLYDQLKCKRCGAVDIY